MSARTPVEARTAVSHVDNLHANPWNRKRFDKQKLQELADSIVKVGVLQPLVVRPQPKDNFGYEIVAGERRFRAAKLAKLEEVPVVVRDLTDVEVVEILAIENAQREDVHPLEEAEQYRYLLDHGAQYDVETIAAKVGKSTSYVYQRLKLAQLIKPAKTAFEKDEISAGHAILIARLEPKLQEEALQYALAADGHVFGEAPPTVRMLQEYIHDGFHLDLHDAPWRKDDGTLVPEAGPCTTCPKRTGFAPDLFPELKKKDQCTDPACFEAKRKALIAARKTELGDDGLLVSTSWQYSQPKSGPLPQPHWKEVEQESRGAKRALVVDGREDVGQFKWVKPVKRQKAATSARADTSWQRQEAARERKAKRERYRRRELLKAIVAKLDGKPLSLTDQRVVATQLFGEVWLQHQKTILELMHWEGDGRTKPSTIVTRRIAKADSDTVGRFLLVAALVPETDFSTYGRIDKAEVLLAVARRHKVDIATIDGAVKAEFAPKRKKAKKKPATKGRRAKRLQTSAKRRARG